MSETSSLNVRFSQNHGAKKEWRKFFGLFKSQCILIIIIHCAGTFSILIYHIRKTILN